jgi:hypothetical protein
VGALSGIGGLDNDYDDAGFDDNRP